MKKLFMAALATTSVLLSPIVLADPSFVELSFTCPNAAGTGLHTLSNFGNRIAGYGMETVAGNPAINFPFFSIFIPSDANIPAKLSTGSYSNDSTDYDSTTGIVACKYISFAGYEPFTVEYALTNGHGGMIVNQTPNTITINAYVGLR